MGEKGKAIISLILGERQEDYPLYVLSLHLIIVLPLVCKEDAGLLHCRLSGKD